ncbi:hypothetical protein ZWY2020_036396 [Hordeum vulgare]|nr:hypothetical protein ZWY2020_036396 [Hordeum vulgare]
MEGIFPFFCSAIRRRRPRPPDRYERLAVPGGLGREHESLAGGGRYQHSQSCRFPARRPGADELGLGHDDDDRPPPEDLSGELSLASGGRDDGRGLSSPFVPAAEAVDRSWRDWESTATGSGRTANVPDDLLLQEWRRSSTTQAGNARRISQANLRPTPLGPAPLPLQLRGSHSIPPPVAHAPQAPQRHPPAGSVRFSSGSRSATRRPSLRKHRIAICLPAAMGIYITQWSAKRLREIANTVKGKKRDVISKSSFGDLLHISPLPPPPEALVDFIVMRIDTKKRLLKLTDRKKIPPTRDLVIYMGHVDIPRGSIVDHSIDYSLPRACFVKELDFTVVIAIDSMEDGFGKRPFSSTTPYATTKFLSYIEQLAQLPNIASVSATEIPVNRDADGAQQPIEGATNEADGRARNVHEPPPKNTEGGDDVCGSLEDWLHPLPTFEDSELPPHMRAIFNKHKDIHAAELKGALSSFGSLLEGIYRKRMRLMLSEASKSGFRRDEAKHECPDVTFDVPAVLAPGMCNATASDSSPQQQKQLDCTTGTANATVNISSPQQPKQHENRVQVTTATAQCTFTASSMQQASVDTNSVDPRVVVGKTDFAHQPHKSKSDHNSGNDFSNTKGEDICSKANKFE